MTITSSFLHRAIVDGVYWFLFQSYEEQSKTYQTVLVLAEFKAPLLTPLQRYSEDRGVLIQGLEKLLADDTGAGQLAKSISKIIKGQRMHVINNGASELGDRSVLAMLVTYEPAFGMHAVQHKANRRLLEPHGHTDGS